jgi:hypothetical protein
MTAEDLPPSCTTIEEDSPDVFYAERISDFNWHSGTGLAITALIPVQWSGADGALVALRDDGSIAVDTDGTFEPPEPFNTARRR